MSRRRTHEAVRNRLITIRVTEDQHHRLTMQAQDNALTLSGLAEKLVTKGRVVVVRQGDAGFDDEVVHELKRVGNNLNQIAHAVNSSLPPVIHETARHMHDVVQLLVKHHYIARHLAEARASESQNGPSTPQARQEFQRNA